MDKKKAFNTKFLSVGLPLVLLLVAAGIAGLILLGYLGVVWKQPSQQATVASANICNDNIVTTYNDVSRLEQRNGSSEYTVDKNGLKTLVSTIKSKTGYQSDATCQTILLLAAIDAKDYANAKAVYAELISLHDEGKYADSNLSTGSTLSAYESLIDEIAPAKKTGGSQEPKGGA